MDDGAAQEKKREQHQNCSHAGDDSPTQHLIDTEVDSIGKRFFLKFVDVFTYTVKHYDGVIDRIAGEGQQSCDQEQIHLHIQ